MKDNYIFKTLFFTFLYVLSTHIGLLLSFNDGFATAVWPGSGLALCLLLIYGEKYWPAIALGAFSINFIHGGSVGAASLICIGNTLEALVAYKIIKLSADSSVNLTKLKSVINFIFASLIGAIISAAIGTLTVFLFSTTEIHFTKTIVTWWLGNVTSFLIIVPIIMLLTKSSLLKLKNTNVLFSFFLLLIVCYFTFFLKYESEVISKLFAYSLIVFPLYSSLKHNRLVALLMVFIISVSAILGTISGNGSFVYSDLNNSLVLLQAFICSMSLTTLIVSTGVKELQSHQKDLTKLLIEKELLVSEIHHRVKNNLAIVSSLLFLQQEKFDNKDVREKIEETQFRIKSMALVHEKLYKNSSVYTVDFSSYIKELTYNINSSYKSADLQIQLNLNIEAHEIDINKATPLGLI